MSDHFLQLSRISKRFAGVRALSEVDFEIRRGELHCLAGENGSGKSTLIKIISGTEQPDSGGQIEIDGQTFSKFNSRAAIAQGVQVIYQDLSLFPNLTVAENIALNRIVEQRWKFFRLREAKKIASEALEKIGARIGLNELVNELSLADQQLVAICRALMARARLLIMDEPTTSLTHREVDTLFAIVKDLQAQGLSVLFVSHKMDEVFEAADRVTVLRDGKKVGTFPASELTPHSFTMHMSGLALTNSPPPPLENPGTARLSVSRLTKKESFADVSFEVFPGEIVGLTGLLGSGRTELAMSLFGLNPADSGTIAIDGKLVQLTSVPQAVREGIAYVPEDRIKQGLVMPQSLTNNVALTTSQAAGAKFGLHPRALDAEAQDWKQRLGVKADTVSVPLETLSGGNQQKVVLAKWLALRPKVLVLDGPTVGIDIASKAAIYQLIRELAATGLSILLISDELPEVLRNCHRVLLMARGRLLCSLDVGLDHPTEGEVRQHLENTLAAAR